MKKPNIIYILADDMGYGDLSCLNEKSKIKTPNFDRLAEDGMIFTDAHSSSAVCTPSRYSILTGRYNWRSSLKKGVLGGFSPPVIENGRMTVASMLQKVGYKTACIGKWHLGMDWGRKFETKEAPQEEETEGIDYSKVIKNGPTTFGFDYFYGISGSLDMPPYVYIENDRVTKIPDKKIEYDWNDWKPIHRYASTASDFVHEEVLPNTSKKTLDIIEEWAKDPFFIYFPLSAPHAPILPTEEFIGKSNLNKYADFVLMCDDVIAQIVKKLKQMKIEDDTIIIYTSDNGCSPMADFETLAKYDHNPNYIFRGYKADIYEGGHRIPLIVKWPHRIKAGSESNEPVCLIDLMSTVADIVGYKLPDDAAEDSVSNLPLLLGEDYKKPLREGIVHHSINGSFSIRKGKWKLEMCPGSGGWSYPRPGEEREGSPPIQLYDLDDDISEKVNVYRSYAEIVKELRDLLIDYIKKGRSTPGEPQQNTGGDYWEQLNWIKDN